MESRLNILGLEREGGSALAAVLALALAAGSAAAQSSTGTIQVLTLDQCLSQGLAHATSLANARREQSIADARIRQARAQVFPSLTARGSYTRLDQVTSLEFSGMQIEMGSLDNYSASLSASQLLYSGGKAGAAIQAARLYRNYASVGAEREQAALVRDIKTSFYDLLLAKAAVLVAQESVNHLADFVARTDEKLAGGKASEFEALTLRVRLANERPNLIAARNNLAVGKEAFANLIHLDSIEFDLQGELAGEPFAESLPALQNAALAGSHELRQMQIRVGLLEQDLRAARGARFPELRAVASYTGQEPDSTDFTSKSWAWHWNAGLALEWQLLDGGLRSNIILEKQLELDKARAVLDEVRRGVILGVNQAWLDLQHAGEAVSGSADNVTMAQKAIEIAGTSYAAGIATHLEVSESNLALSAARLAHAKAVRDQLNAVARLRYACGMQEAKTKEDGKP